MPHSRARLLAPLLKKRLKLSPVVALQGARQTGKSFLAKNIVPELFEQSVYRTFDLQSDKAAASTSPQDFLASFDDARPLILDEAQKVPEIFDAIKYRVDQSRVPGSYLLLGSTEFSKEVLIRESLTGRMSKVRVFPFNLYESLGLKKNADHSKINLRKSLLKYLAQGGLPGIFYLHDAKEREQQIQAWMDLSCYRDLLLFKTKRLDGDLAALILRECSLSQEPTIFHISRALNIDPRRIKSHIEALVQLFVLVKLPPHPTSFGKDLYLPLDCAVANYFGATRERLLHIWLLLERMCLDSYLGEKRKYFFYYRSKGGHLLHLIEEDHTKRAYAFGILLNEKLKKTETEILKAFITKNPRSSGKMLGPVTSDTQFSGVTISPWESAAGFFNS
jgi:predicted AAA+ superfamily ATPase